MGREMAIAFAKAGADIVIVSRKLDACEKVAAEVEALGQRALPYSCHIGRWDEVDELVEAVYDHFGRIDILVNNAGMSPVYDSLVNISEKLWDSVLNLNLKGAFRLAALVGDRMVKGEGGSIINISSIAATRPSAIEAPYAAAKAGLNSLTSALAEAYGPKVRVNCIMPGPFLTDIAKSWDMDVVMKKFESYSALKRPGNSEEIIGTALYLASNASSFTTNAFITVDGGYRR